MIWAGILSGKGCLQQDDRYENVTIIKPWYESNLASKLVDRSAGSWAFLLKGHSKV